MTLTTVSVEREDDIDLLRYGRFLAAYWRVIAISAAAGAIIGLLVAFTAPVRYQATVTMTVTQATSGTPLALTPATSRALFANLTLVAETLKEAGIEGMTPQAFVEDALTIQSVPTTTLLRLSVALPDPAKARLAADILSRKAIALSKHLDEDGAIATRDALKAQTDEAARRLSEAGTRLSAFEATHHMEQRAELTKATAELEAEKSRLVVLDREAAAYRGARSPSRETVTVPAGAGDGNTSGVNLPVAEALRYQAAESRVKIAALERRLRDAETGGGTIVKRLDETSRLRVEYDLLTMNYETSKGVYGDLSAKYAAAAGRVSANAPQVLLVDSAVQPDRPMPRQAARWAVFGIIVGFVAAIAGALLFNSRRHLGGHDDVRHSRQS